MNNLLNIQPIEKLIKTPLSTMDTELDVIDIFATIQGEGPFTGHPAIFVRLAGCNLQCPSCDTDYTTNRQKIKTEEIVKEVLKLAIGDHHLIVITGGEPFRQNISTLCNAFLMSGLKVQVETNGTLPPPEGISKKVVIVCSPKAGRINKTILKRADCFKYVMAFDSVDIEDGLPVLALNHTASPRVARPLAGVPVYLQPMDHKDIVLNKYSMDAVLKSCLKYGHIMQLQIHKIIGVE